jgi:hypothetical protein
VDSVRTGNDTPSRSVTIGSATPFFSPSMQRPQASSSEPLVLSSPPRLGHVRGDRRRRSRRVCACCPARDPFVGTAEVSTARRGATKAPAGMRVLRCSPGPRQVRPGFGARTCSGHTGSRGATVRPEGPPGSTRAPSGRSARSAGPLCCERSRCPRGEDHTLLGALPASGVESFRDCRGARLECRCAAAPSKFSQGSVESKTEKLR